MLVRGGELKLRVKLPAVPVRTRLVNVATPFTVLAVVVPVSVPLPEPTCARIEVPDVVTTLLFASSRRTDGC